MNTRKGPSIYIRIKSRNFKLIFKGIKMILEKKSNNDKINMVHVLSKGGFINSNYTHRYRSYRKLSLCLSLFLLFIFIKKYLMKFEFQLFKKPNCFIPRIIYRIRREHYIYWEKSRIARGLQTTFSYYNFDNNSKMMNVTDNNGNIEVKKVNFNLGFEIEKAMENPLLEFVYNKSKFNEKKANKVLYYYININNKVNLDNYLLYKAINPMDFIRCFYSIFMKFTQIADIYRNEQYLPKPDILYDLEHLMIQSNFNKMNKKEVLDDFCIISLYLICYIYKNLISLN